MEIIKSFHFSSFPSTVGFYKVSELLTKEPDLIVFDNNTAPLLNLPQDVKHLIIPPGEEFKNEQTLSLILDKALKSELGRDALFIGVGGGVLCDMTAFASSIYMRGAKLILIPTTLLAMVDAAVGGKTGIDVGSYKNMIGSFYPASEVRICPDFIKTLPEKEYLNGLGEILKTALIGDYQMFDLIRSHIPLIKERDPSLLKELIKRCVLVKGHLVEEDLRESGCRAFLNLGHTFGHALEAVSHFDWDHGAAVVWGMGKALDAGVALGKTNRDWARGVKDIFKSLGYSLEAQYNIDELLEAMKRDKKKKGGQVRFILPFGPENMYIQPLEDSLLRAIL